jgi:hypothetical protein
MFNLTLCVVSPSMITFCASIKLGCGLISTSGL